MAFKDIRPLLTEIPTTESLSGRPREIQIEAIFQELAGELGVPDSAAAQEQAQEFMVIYDKFANRTR